MKAPIKTIEKIQAKNYTFTATKNGCIIRKFNPETMRAVGFPATYPSATTALKSITRGIV